jgi:transcriptional regulator of acetoin/glycerol metabolism
LEARSAPLFKWNGETEEPTKVGTLKRCIFNSWKRCQKAHRSRLSPLSVPSEDKDKSNLRNVVNI